MKYYVFAFFFLLGSCVCGQDTAKTKIEIKHFIGAGAGFTTGYGLSYRLIYDKYGAQLNFGPMSSQNSFTTISSGLTLLYKLAELDESNIYVYWGNHLFYRNEVHFYLSNGLKYNEKSTKWNTGLGIDLELNKEKRLVFNIMFGFGAYDSFITKTLTGELGLHYRIN